MRWRRPCAGGSLGARLRAGRAGRGRNRCSPTASGRPALGLANRSGPRPATAGVHLAPRELAPILCPPRISAALSRQAHTSHERKGVLAMATLKEQALEYHVKGRPGKLEIRVTKPASTQRDLSLAYSPGVAEPCRRLLTTPRPRIGTPQGQPGRGGHQRHRRAGPGQRRSARAKPVMEGKAFCSSASPISTSTTSRSTLRDPDGVHPTPSTRWSPRSAASTWRTSRRPSASRSKSGCGSRMDIPVFHDDQHGTAIIPAPRS